MKAFVLHVFRSLGTRDALDIGFESKTGPFAFPAGNFLIRTQDALRLAEALQNKEGHRNGQLIALETVRGASLEVTVQDAHPNPGVKISLDDPQADARLEWILPHPEAARLSEMIEKAGA